MATPKLEKLTDLLQSYADEGKTVKETQISRLTGPGENFGSIMLRVEAKVEGTDGKEETWHVVAKCLPDEGFLREMFQVDASVVAETKFYSDIIPLLHAFQREQGITDVVDYFPRFYGGRLNLKEEGNKVDDQAVIILENLIVAGYKNLNRYVGFNFDEAKVVIRDLASFHAVFLAMSIRKPKEFEDILKYCVPMKEDMPAPPIGTLLTDMLEDYEECKPYMEKLKSLVQQFKDGPVKDPVPSDLFKTIIHSDMWVNNTMQKVEDGKVVGNKFVDFQFYNLDSVMHDLLSLLFTSCQYVTLRNHIEELITLYFDNFVLTLKQHNCDTSQYTIDKMHLELKRFAEPKTVIIMFFTTFIVFGKKNVEADGTPKFTMQKEEVSEEVKNRLAFMIEYFGNHGWL